MICPCNGRRKTRLKRRTTAYRLVLIVVETHREREREMRVWSNVCKRYHSLVNGSTTMLLTFILIKVQIIMMFFLLFISFFFFFFVAVFFSSINVVCRICIHRLSKDRLERIVYDEFLPSSCSLSLSPRSYQSFEATEEQSVNVDWNVIVYYDDNQKKSTQIDRSIKWKLDQW